MDANETKYMYSPDADFDRVVMESSDRIIGEGNALNEAQLKPNQIPGFQETTNWKPHFAAEQQMQQKKKKKLISKVLSELSRMGMNYEDKVIENMRALPADKSLLPKPEQFLVQDLFNQVSSKWKVKSNADKSFYEKDFDIKREALRKLAVQPELEDILDTMCNECVVYDSNYTYFAEPYIEEREITKFTPEIQSRINKSVNDSFARFYKLLNFQTEAWDVFKRWLIEGILCYEIVYDNIEKPKQIISIVPIDPATITRKYKDNKIYWVQFDGMNGKERTLLDSEIIYIAYQETQSINRISYLERLVRPFNIYRIIEQAQIVWTVANAQPRTVFKIPLRGMSKAVGMTTLASAMNKYKEDIKFSQDSGEITFNGRPNQPFNHEYWFPETEAGAPEMENITGDGPELNDNDQLSFFKKQLYRISKIPFSRFDEDNGETWFGADASSVARTEIDFGRFVTRQRNRFAQIMLKPVKCQLLLDVPELIDNKEFLSSIQLQWKSYNLFEEMMEMDLMSKRVQFIQELKESLIDMDAEGNENKWFSSEFLVRKYLHLSDADIQLNDKLKKAEIEKYKEMNGSEIEDEDDF